MQNDLLREISEIMTRLIEGNLSAPFPAVEFANPELVLGRDSLGRIAMVNMDGPSGYSRETPRSSHSDLSQRPDKVGHILNSWKWRFSENPEGLSVDNFIYRAEALTKQTLEGNFWILSSNASLLFEGKAREFY